VANAVLDGTDGVLLGAETLRGKYPAITVKTVLAICRQAEEVFDYSGHFEWLTLQGEMVCKSLLLPLRSAYVAAHLCVILRLSMFHCPFLVLKLAFQKQMQSMQLISADQCVLTNLHVLVIHTPGSSLFGQSCKQIVSMFACTSLSSLKARLLFLQDDKAMTRRKRTTSDEDLTVDSPGCYLLRLLHVTQCGLCLFAFSDHLMHHWTVHFDDVLHLLQHALLLLISCSKQRFTYV